MEENMNREDVIEELEEKAAAEGLTVEDLPACPYEEDGLDLKSMAIGGAVIGAIALVTVKGPKVVDWVKSKIPKRKSKKTDDEDFNRDFDEDADFKEVPDDEESNQEENE